MTTTIHLQAGVLACDIRPDLGGCIAGLWLDGAPVLRSTPGDKLETVRRAGSYPLVPYSNRVGHATLQWNGTGHPLVQNNAPEPHAIHGVGWQRPWDVLDQSDTFLLLSHEHRADPAWPFAYDASQTFRLTPDALELTLSITNQSPAPAPAGLGWHPYFTKRAGSRVSFDATGRWDMGDDKLPTERRASTGLDAACTELDVDHCFDGWSGTARLRDDVMDMRLGSDLRRLVVFTNDTRDFIAIEPVSHVNNALGGGHADVGALGVRVLAPGESMSVTMTLEIQKRRHKQ
jgi:aldose 1-epimerase